MKQKLKKIMCLDDHTVAQVNESGMITAVSEGTANISVFVKNDDYWTQSNIQISVVQKAE